MAKLPAKTFIELYIVTLSLLTKNLWYEQREQLDSGGGGTLSQGAGHDGSFYRYTV